MTQKALERPKKILGSKKKKKKSKWEGAEAWKEDRRGLTPRSVYKTYSCPCTNTSIWSGICSQWNNLLEKEASTTYRDNLDIQRSSLLSCFLMYSKDCALGQAMNHGRSLQPCFMASQPQLLTFWVSLSRLSPRTSTQDSALLSLLHPLSRLSWRPTCLCIISELMIWRGPWLWPDHRGHSE